IRRALPVEPFMLPVEGKPERLGVNEGSIPVRAEADIDLVGLSFIPHVAGKLVCDMLARNVVPGQIATSISGEFLENLGNGSYVDLLKRHEPCTDPIVPDVSH